MRIRFDRVVAAPPPANRKRLAHSLLSDKPRALGGVITGAQMQLRVECRCVAPPPLNALHLANSLLSDKPRALGGVV